MDDLFDASILTCGSLKYGSLAIFVACLLLGTWGTNNYVGINVREMKMLIELREKMVASQKSKPKTREAPLLEPQKALLSKLQEVLPPEPHKALLPKLPEVFPPEPPEVPVLEQQEALLSNFQKVPLSEALKALVPKFPEVLLLGPQEDPRPEPQEALQHKLQDILPETQDALQHKLQEVPLPEFQEAFLSKLRENPLPESEEVSQPKLLEVPQQKLLEIRQPKLQEVTQPSLQEVPLVRLWKRDDQLVSNASNDVDATIEKLTDENGVPHKVDSNEMKSLLQTEFQNLSNEKHDESPNLSNEKQEFQNLSFGDRKVQNLSSGNAEFHNISGPKLELQQEHSNKVGFDTTDNIVSHLLVPDTVNETATNVNKSAALEESDEVAYDNLMNKSQGSFAVAGIFSIAWVASIYGLVSLVTGLKELLIAPAAMFVAASIGCVGLVFVDMGVFETSGYFAGIIYFLLLLGAVFKIIAAVIFLYCYFVVYGYYKELRDGPSAPEAPSRPSPPRPAQSPPKPAPPPPRPAKSPPKPARSPPKPPSKPAQSPPKPIKSPPPRPPPPSPKRK